MKSERLDMVEANAKIKAERAGVNGSNKVGKEQGRRRMTRRWEDDERIRRKTSEIERLCYIYGQTACRGDMSSLRLCDS